MNDLALYAGSLCAAASLALVWNWRRGRPKLPFPPGPKGLPLLGNVLDVPRGLPMWQGFASLARKYGTDVLYLRLLMKDVVVLSSFEAISDLPEKRSNIYSDRPYAPMVELMGYYSWNIGLIGCGSKWKNARRLLHEFLGARAVANFDDYQRKHTYRFLLHLAESPEIFRDHIEFLIGALVMEMTYGLNITNKEDRFLRAALESLKSSLRAMIPGAFLVDTIPILKHVPEWFPGAEFKAYARVARAKANIAVDGTLEYVKEWVQSGGGGKPSVAWSCFGCAPETGTGGFSESVIRSATGTLFMAAVDTTASILYTFFLAMALNPHVMKKAQEELDGILGGERLPDFSDKENLPYVSAIVKEVLRWGCPAPIGVPKRTVEDDTYNGYFIPAGTTVIENLWALFRDESLYPAPEKFDPERYLNNGKLDFSVRDPEERVFGAGRRICPGKHFAMRTLFLNITCVISLFDVEAPTDGTLKANFEEDRVVRKPIPFKCTIKPRSDASLELMKSWCAPTDH